MAKAAKTQTKGGLAKIQAGLLSQRIEALEDEFDLTANTLIRRKRFSTGILALDMQWGGGMVPGMYTIAGIEKSGKSTIITSIFGEMVRGGIAISQLRDAEGTVGVDVEYTRALLGDGPDLSELIAGSSEIKKTKKEEALSTKPRIHVEPNIEETYEFFRAVMDLLPDKIYSKKDKCWVFKAPNTKEGQAQMELLGPDAPIEKRKRNGKEFLYAPTEDGIIGFIAIDSYPALLPTAVDEKGERSKRMGQEASAFANSLPLIVEKLVKKGFVVLGANQLRENPGDQYNPWREPGGNALKQYSQVRDWIHAIAPGTAKTKGTWEKGEGNLSSRCKEESVEDGKVKFDYYQFSYLQNKKNKTATPMRRAEIRIWERDCNEVGRGIDPVFDTWFFLSETDTATVHARRITCEKLFGESKVHWLDFKRMILAEVKGDEEELSKVWKAAVKKKPLVKIRSWCFAELRRMTGSDPDEVEQSMTEVIKKPKENEKAEKVSKPVKDKAVKAKNDGKTKTKKTKKKSKK